MEKIYQQLRNILEEMLIITHPKCPEPRSETEIALRRLAKKAIDVLPITRRTCGGTGQIVQCDGEKFSCKGCPDCR